MNFRRPLFWSQPVDKLTIDAEITMVVLWCWHEASISAILWRHGLERQKKNNKKKKQKKTNKKKRNKKQKQNNNKKNNKKKNLESCLRTVKY